MAALGNNGLSLCAINYSEAVRAKSKPSVVVAHRRRGKTSEICSGFGKSIFLAPIKTMEASETAVQANCQAKKTGVNSTGDFFTSDCGKSAVEMLTVGNSSNIAWHKCSVEKRDREELLNQRGCVIWITGLSGSGKSTLACALSCALHAKGKLTYILDGDNCRHGLNRDLSFKAEDRAENIRRVGEVAKLFADAGIICIASLISPFRKEREACRKLLPKGDFIEIYMDVPLQVCESRDPKGLYKLARAGKIKGFTGVDDPYEPPLNCEVVLHQKEGNLDSPSVQAEKVVSYLEQRGLMEA